MSHSMRRFPTSQSQRGVALIVSLMFLIVLTLLGLATMRGTTLEEKMAGGSRDYNLALQAAEAALRDGENDLRGTPVVDPATGNPLVFGTPRYLTTYSFPPPGANACIAGGLCYITTADTTQLYNTSTVDWTTSSTTSIRYGTYTGASTIPGVAQQPRYVLEMMAFSTGGNKAGNNGTNDLFFVRITARAWGASTQTQVYLQEIYKVPLPTS